jgi:hypothetical protein
MAYNQASTAAAVKKELEDAEEEDTEEDEEVAEKGRTPLSALNLATVAAYLVNFIVTYTSTTGIFGATNGDLSNKYQTLVTPDSWAFIIWAPIFIWEGIFAFGQLCPGLRGSKVVKLVSPWWIGLCVFQCAWTIVFAREWITVALICMLCILASLFGVAWDTDGLSMSLAEYFVVRAPLSLQLGWIIAASCVNVNVQVDAAKASQDTLLAFAILTNAAVLGVVAVFTFAVKSPDPFVGFVAAWAFLAVRSELANPGPLNDPDRFNPSTWDVVILDALQKAALGISVACLIMAVLATAMRILQALRDSKTSEDSDAEE